MLRSPQASARITDIDTAAAREAPGVAAVFTAADLAGTCAPMRVHLTTAGAIAPDRPIIAVDRVRFVGEIVAVVVADSRYQAEDALELIQVDLVPLTPVITFEDAMSDGAPLVHDSVPKNQYFLGHRTIGNVDKAFAQADIVVEGEVVHPRVSAAPMEGRGVVAMPDGSGGVIAWSSTQAPHLVVDAIAESLGLDEKHVRVVASDVGVASVSKHMSTPRRSCCRGSACTSTGLSNGSRIDPSTCRRRTTRATRRSVSARRFGRTAACSAFAPPCFPASAPTASGRTARCWTR